MLGDDETDAKEIVISNRVLKWNGKHLIYKADDKHVARLRREFNMENESTNGSQTACDKKELEGDDEKLDEAKVSWFRGVAARANFLSLDRMDIQYAAKEICRNMAAPTMGGLRKLKRLVRYLVQVPEAELHVGASEIIHGHGGCLSVDVYVDSD